MNINYRLGIFGFLAHPELSQEDRENMALGDKAGAKTVSKWNLHDGGQYCSHPALLLFPCSY